MFFLARLKRKFRAIMASSGSSCSFLRPWMPLVCILGVPFCSPPAAERTQQEQELQCSQQMFRVSPHRGFMKRCWVQSALDVRRPRPATGEPAPKQARMIEANYFVRLQELVEWRRSGLLGNAG